MNNITLREALLCAMTKATDERGRRLQDLERGHAIRLAVAIDEHLNDFGWKIVPMTSEAPPPDDPAEQTLISALTELGDTLKRIEWNTERTARAAIEALPEYKQEAYREPALTIRCDLPDLGVQGWTSELEVPEGCSPREVS